MSMCQDAGECLMDESCFLIEQHAATQRRLAEAFTATILEPVSGETATVAGEDN